MQALENREKAIRLAALKGAIKAARPEHGIADLLIHAGWLLQFAETGRGPAIDSVVTASGMSGNQVPLDSES